MALDSELTAICGFFSFWLGACVASFLNVVAWRLPRGASIVSPPSPCPKRAQLVLRTHGLGGAGSPLFTVKSANLKLLS